MPRYWLPGYKGYHYCWADNADQARKCMDALFALMDKRPLNVEIALAMSQEPPFTQTFDTIHEHDFRTKPEPLPKEVTDDDT